MLTGVTSSVDDRSGAFTIIASLRRQPAKEARTISDQDHPACSEESTKKDHAEWNQSRAMAAAEQVNTRSNRGGRRRRPEDWTHIGGRREAPDSPVDAPNRCHDKVEGYQWQDCPSHGAEVVAYLRGWK